MCYIVYMPSSKRSRIGIRDLRQNLSVYLEQVKRGRSLLVTEHGRPVAELRPVPADTDIIERLARDRLVVRARRRPRALPPPVNRGLRVSLSGVLDELRADRI
jgi:prevent-host-death family protein